MQNRHIYYIYYAAGNITIHHHQVAYLRCSSHVPHRIQIPQAHSSVAYYNTPAMANLLLNQHE